MFILVHVSHPYKILGISTLSISFMLISMICFLNAGSLIKNFISLMIVFTEFLLLLMHSSTVPLLFFISPRYLYLLTSFKDASFSFSFLPWSLLCLF